MILLLYFRDAAGILWLLLCIIQRFKTETDMIRSLLGLSLTALIFGACTEDHNPQPTAKT